MNPLRHDFIRACHASQPADPATPTSGLRYLDVGCGGGFLLDHFRNHGWTVSGIEPSPVAVEFASERFGIDVFCGELLDYQPPEAAPSAG